MFITISVTASMIVTAYLLGSIPWGFIIGKLHGIDVRTVGSKNIGATNVTRTVGKFSGKVCFLLDFLKGMLPVFGATWVCHTYSKIVPEWVVVAVMVAAIFGHIFPVFLKFKGGKGVSTAAGAILALAWMPLAIALVVWVLIFLISRYVSLASITAAVVLAVVAWVFHFVGIGDEVARSLWTLWFLTAVVLLTVFRHRSNIQRLLNGTENRFGKNTNAVAESDEKEEGNAGKDEA